MVKFFKKISSISIILIITIAILLASFSLISMTSYVPNKNNKVYKVAFYNHAPYYYVNNHSQPDGYYHKLMELLSNKLNIKYEYVYLELKDCINKLINNEIDIVFGVSKDTDKEKNILFSEYSIGKEDVSVYTRKNIKNEDLNALEGLRFGYLNYESNNDLFRDMLDKKNINVKLIEYNTYNQLKKGLIEDEVDSIVYLSSDNDLKRYNKIYNFSVGELYIATSPKNKELINDINFFFEKNLNSKYNNKIDRIYLEYFNENLIRHKSIFTISLILLIILVVIIVFFISQYLIDIRRATKLKNTILCDFERDHYILYYQPIINPKTDTIKGFEGLLRLKKEDEIFYPHAFFDDIENTNLMGYTSFWTLSKAIEDYNIIKNCNELIDDNFYISINISFRELEDIHFIDAVSSLLKSSTLSQHSICLEIIERFAIKDLQKIQSAIYKLKEAGFIVAIDDFGVEYSNLDILEKIDCDIVKLDKYFIDDIDVCYIRREVIKFISNVSSFTNKVVVCEGVETEHQRDIIKNIENENFYIQGYYYSKPLDINNLKDFKIK